MAFNDEKFRLFWRFASDDGTFSDPEALANYPVGNLKIDALSKKWKSAPDSGGVVQVTVDLGSAQAISAFAFLNHNLLSGDSALLRYADDSGFSVGVGTQSITFHEDTFIEYFTEVTKRYWRLEITVANSAITEVEAGRLVLGPHYQFERNVAPSFSGPATTQDTTRNIRTRGGQRYSDEGTRLRTFRGQFTALRNADFVELEALRQAYGTSKSLVISQLWEDYPVVRTLYGSIDSLSPSDNAPGTADRWNMSLRMTEQK
jgi:hypothetical protein